MKKKNGFAISAIIYMILVLFLLLLLSTLSILASNKVALDKVKNEVMSEVKDNVNISGNVFSYSYTGDVQIFEAPISGIYKIELWGAQGGNTTLTGYPGTGGAGAYTVGTISLNKDYKLYIYVGGKGTNGRNERTTTLNAGGYNGGGSNGSLDAASTAGGGATDIRLVKGIAWNDFDSLKSRIMVAGAGGGSGISNVGAPGGLNTGIYGTLYGGNGTQTFGGIAGTGYSNDSGAKAGQFGIGGNSGYFVTGAGGSGYYGGGGGNHYTPSTSGGGGGGSSFISGAGGCNAIAESSTQSNITHTNQANHYSGLVFKNTNMISGDKYIPSYDGMTTMIGNTGNGYAKITKIS